MGDDAEIDLAGTGELHQVERRLADDRDLDPRIGAREAGEHLGKEALGIVVGSPELDASRELGLVEGGDGLFGQANHAAGIAEEALTVLGEPGGAAVAGEDRLADPLLQPAHLHRHRRLGLEHDLRGAGEAAGLGDGNEGPELVEVEGRRHRGVSFSINDLDARY